MAETYPEGISGELLQRMENYFQALQATDPVIRAFHKKLSAGKATQADVAAYAERLGAHVNTALWYFMTPEELPNEKLYYNILRNTAGQMLRIAHERVNAAAIEAQRAIDEAQGLGLRAVPAPYPERRVQDLFYKAGAPDATFEAARQIVERAIPTLTRAFHDDHIRYNAEQRYRAGMAPKIVRHAAAGCCRWCSNLGGTYDYEDVRDTGNDVFRRHENCRCSVEYVCESGRRDVWSKKLYEADEETLRERETYRTETGDTSPETLQARSAYGLEAEQDAAGENGVANGGERGIIQEDEMISLSSHNMHNSSDILYERVKHVQPIQGYDDVFLHGDAFGVATRNADGTEIDIPFDEFIKTLRQLNLENSAIRLCSCSAGEKDRGLAFLVAREMNMPVMASTTDVWIEAPDDEGISEMKLYRDDGDGQPDYNKPGIWRIFMPDGRIIEVKT